MWTAGSVAEPITFGKIFEFLGAVLWTIASNEFFQNSVSRKNEGEGVNDSQ